jgi:hypothetical protein
MAQAAAGEGTGDGWPARAGDLVKEKS